MSYTWKFMTCNYVVSSYITLTTLFTVFLQIRQMSGASASAAAVRPDIAEEDDDNDIYILYSSRKDLQ